MSAPTDPVCVTHWDRVTTRRALGALLALVVAASATEALPLGGRHGVARLEGRVPTEIELSPSVEAAFPRESYAPRSTARLVVSNRTPTWAVVVLISGASARKTMLSVNPAGWSWTFTTAS